MSNEVAIPTLERHTGQSLLIGSHLLCSQKEWLWDAYDGHRLIFYPDGTGEIISRAEAIVRIVAGTDWKLLPCARRMAKPAKEKIAIPPDPFKWEDFLQPVSSREPTTLFAGTLQLTITKRRPLLYRRVVHNIINEEILLDGAFEARETDLIIESREFHLVLPRLGAA
ncbi:hypothetical protein B0H19DRAFT_1068816 [Mycena capillaripes]|nr:hypothetical protein B0H19DRAFT_1068816 [Mycena capillaripes]